MEPSTSESAVSLSSFLKLTDVKTKLTSLRPKLPGKINAPLLVKLRSPRYVLVGTAFVYLLRFELHRRAPHATTKTWVAEYVPETIWRPGAYLRLPTVAGQDEVEPPMSAGPQEWMALAESKAKEAAGRARTIVAGAKIAEAAFRKNKRPSRANLAELAAYAIRLAKLDDLFRGGRLDPTFEEADRDDIEEL